MPYAADKRELSVKEIFEKFLTLRIFMEQITH